jgi:hypothetical protein
MKRSARQSGAEAEILRRKEPPVVGGPTAYFSIF